MLWAEEEPKGLAGVTVLCFYHKSFKTTTQGIERSKKIKCG